MPVLPLVESSRVLPEANFPLRRPSEMMLNAARSLTEPPGLYHSALASTCTLGNSRAMRSSRSKGVLPMRAMVRWPSRALRARGSAAAHLADKGFIGVELRAMSHERATSRLAQSSMLTARGLHD